jgi:hypothetical protein
VVFLSWFKEPDEATHAVPQQKKSGVVVYLGMEPQKVSSLMWE